MSRRRDFRSLLLVFALLMMPQPGFTQGAANGQGEAPKGDSPAGQEDGEDEEELTIQIGLREAYKREFAFLVGQRRRLEERRDRLEERFQEEVKTLESIIQNLESRYLRLEERTQALQQEVQDAKKQGDNATGGEQLVVSTLEQARTTLDEQGIEVEEAPEDADPAPLLEERFDHALGLLDRLSSPNQTEGEFFASDGTKTQGEILHLGRVAAYGANGQAAGILVPAGEGKLKVWTGEASEAARALISGAPPEKLPIFLYESMDTAVEETEGETIIEHIQSGGAIAWAIIGLGALGLLLILVRTFLLGRYRSNTDALEERLEPLVREGRVEEAMHESRRSKGTASRILTDLFSSLSRGNEDVDDVLSQSLLAENRRISRFGTVILVIAAVSPLLGLLGTVTGMISTFEVITKFGTGDPKLLSGGISTALVTTELGLTVAIPTLLLGNLLRGWGERIESEAEGLALRLLNIHREQQVAATSDSL